MYLESTDLIFRRLNKNIHLVTQSISVNYFSLSHSRSSVGDVFFLCP